MRIEDMTIEEIKRGYINKSYSVREITQCYFNRIMKYDKNINSFLTVEPDAALRDADLMDQNIKKGEDLGVLAGIPVAVKDNISTRGIRTTCASRILEDYIPPYDATIIKNLKLAGAIVIGKTNMDEFAMGSSTENSAFKITRNPWNYECVPGGSSGGSAAAVAAGFTPLAIGSDTGGSIRQPASFCGIVGIKPTYGLVSRYGLIAFASSLDQIGPMTRTVKDCALSLQAIQGGDLMDGTSYQGAVNKDYLKDMEQGIQGMKIGIPKEFFQAGLDETVSEAVKDTIKLFEKMGAFVEEFSMPAGEVGLSAYYIISSAEASSNLARYDGIRYGFRSGEYESIEQLIVNTRSEGFGAEVKRRIMLGTYALSSGYYEAYYKKAQLLRNKISWYFSEAFKSYDLILSPTSPMLPFKIGEKKENPLEMYLADIYTVNINIAGLPAISIPCGFSSEGLPIGMQLIGGHFREDVLFKAAYSLEKEIGISGKTPTLKEV